MVFTYTYYLMQHIKTTSFIFGSSLTYIIDNTNTNMSLFKSKFYFCPILIIKKNANVRYSAICLFGSSVNETSWLTTQQSGTLHKMGVGGWVRENGREVSPDPESSQTLCVGLFHSITLCTSIYRVFPSNLLI